MIPKQELLTSPSSLFSLQEQGVSISEFEQIQVDLRNKLFLSNSYFFPGNTPSLKNNKDIVEMWITSSLCCKAPVRREGKGKFMKAYCEGCGNQTRMKRPIITSSKRVKEYIKALEGCLLQNKPKFIMNLKNSSKPYIVGFYFIRATRHRFDFGNAMEVLLDAFTEYGYWEDDNMDVVMNFPLGYHVDPNRPGAYVVVMDNSFLREIIRFI